MYLEALSLQQHPAEQNATSVLQAPYPYDPYYSSLMYSQPMVVRPAPLISILL